MAATSPSAASSTPQSRRSTTECGAPGGSSCAGGIAQVLPSRSSSSQVKLTVSARAGRSQDRPSQCRRRDAVPLPKVLKERRQLGIRHRRKVLRLLQAAHRRQPVLQDLPGGRIGASIVCRSTFSMRLRTRPAVTGMAVQIGLWTVGRRCARTIIRPGGEQLSSLGEQLRSPISALDLVADEMGETHFGDFAREAGLLGRPIAEC